MAESTVPEKLDDSAIGVILALIQAVREENKETKKHVAALEKEYELVAAQQAELLRIFKTLKSFVKWFGTAVTILVGLSQLLMFFHI